MIANNIFDLLKVAGAYFLLFALLPFWIRGYKLSGDNVLGRLVSSYLYGTIILIMCAYLLSLMGIFYNFTIIGLLILVAAVYRLTLKRSQTVEAFNLFITGIRDLSDGYYHPRVLIRNTLNNIRAFLFHIINKITNPVGFISTLAIFGYAVYIRSYHSVTNLFFGSSDMYTHLEWIKFFTNNRPFYAGVYPFGYHAVVSSLSSVFRINVITVMQMLGPVVGILTVFSLYYILRRTMRSLFAVNVVLALYCVTDIFPFWASERQFLALPQEFGTIFLYMAAYFLYKYIKEKKLKDLISFSIAASLTALTHLFVTVYVALICIPIFIFCIAYLNKKIFVRIIIGTVCAILAAAVPLAVGLAKGIPLNYSFGWAASVISGDIEEDSPVTENEDAESKKEPFADSIFQYPTKIYETLAEREYFNPSAVLWRGWFIPYLIAAAICLVSPLFKFKNKNKERQWIYVGFSVYSLILLMLYVLANLNIFALMEYSRLYAFFIYSVPLVLCVPLELLHNLLCGTKRLAKTCYITLISAASLTGIFYIGYYQRFMPLGRILQTQHNGAITAYYEIKNNFPVNNWLIVSSFSEYSFCLFEGYHYEMTEFIYNLSEVSEDEINNPPLILDVENVFFYVAKRPNKYLDTDIVQLGTYNDLPLINENDVYNDIEEFNDTNSNHMSLYYNYETNRILQAKAYAWAKEYIKYYPDEMTVFYEDDDIIVYHIKQNTYSLNNFAIFYDGNDGQLTIDN